MRKYETVVVFAPSLGEAELKDAIKKVQGIIESRGGTEITVNPWGKKEIAYPVGKNTHGHFICFNFSSENSDLVAELTALLRITERVIKFQTHRLNETSRKFKGNPKKIAAREAGEDFFAGDSDY